ncbi:hypothetical protein HDU85_002495 [Gaertneriomyces sp. JEL0708]|nr:hypothetical protein HDU85_002495 [Gaertneriomyces sp. JEL0708]
MSLHKALFKTPLQPSNATAISELVTPSPTWKSEQIVTVRGTFQAYSYPPPTVKSPIFFFIHGAGHTALSWALVAEKIKVFAGVLAIDVRGHGDTETEDDDDLSMETLVDDLVTVWTTKFHAGWEGGVVVVGHSMGGALAVNLVLTRRINRLVGLVVLDVVEGTALESLAHMEVILRNRPQEFETPQHAVKWAVASGTIRNRESAIISVPSMLRCDVNTGIWKWRTSLEKSKGYWKGWFEGLSERFLKAPANRVLVLAGTDRLDTPLTIGQMQGKYQLVLYPEAGHAIQEDQPNLVAETLKEFWDRYGVIEIKRFPIPIRKQPA